MFTTSGGHWPTRFLNAPREQDKPAEVRFYVDADLLGLTRALAERRHDVTYPGDPGTGIHKRHRPLCPIASPAVKDPEWVPEVARRGWLIITRRSPYTGT